MNDRTRLSFALLLVMTLRRDAASISIDVDLQALARRLCTAAERASQGPRIWIRVPLP